ncbi:MAG: hypothetical protein WBP41_07890, partial [Saprospiraceae bacterium]
DFYRKLIFQKSAHDIKVLDRVDYISIGDHIIVSNENLNKIIEIFNIDTLKAYQGLGFEVIVEGK